MMSGHITVTTLSMDLDGMHIVICNLRELLFFYSMIHYSHQIKEKVICFSTLQFLVQDFSVTILLILVKLITC